MYSSFAFERHIAKRTCLVQKSVCINTLINFNTLDSQCARETRMSEVEHDSPICSLQSVSNWCTHKSRTRSRSFVPTPQLELQPVSHPASPSSLTRPHGPYRLPIPTSRVVYLAVIHQMVIEVQTPSAQFRISASRRRKLQQERSSREKA